MAETPVNRLGRDPGRGQRGSLMVMVMIILVALLAGGAVMLSLQLGSTKQAGLASDSRGALFCAEAGLAAARPVIGANYSTWSDAIDSDTSNDPAWYPITGDLDGDAVDDYEVTLEDNDDEFAPTADDPDHDNDLKVFVKSSCTKYPDTPREVLELVSYEGGGSVYRNQSGSGGGNTGNEN
jgi:hypothetical protein